LKTHIVWSIETKDSTTLLLNIHSLTSTILPNDGIDDDDEDDEDDEEGDDEAKAAAVAALEKGFERIDIKLRRI